MPETSQPSLTHVKTGILLVNLGTPDAPTPKAVRAYLKEFLGDPRVVDLPRLLWWPILHGIILNTRPKKSAAKYASIWTKEGSPLRVHTEKQAALLQGYLGERSKAPFTVEYAMRYGQPSIPTVMHRLAEQGCSRLLVVPMYPQYSFGTTATVTDVVDAAMRKMRDAPGLRTVTDFHQHPGYIKALANSINAHWMKEGRPDKLLMSFHGLPLDSVDKGDPYYEQCLRSGKALAQELGLDEQRYHITFQSRFGRKEWLQPYTSVTLEELGRQKVSRLDVVCPGFVADCLETLEEIAQEGKEIFRHAGGGEYRYIPCLNERDDWMHALTDLVQENLQGWL